MGNNRGILNTCTRLWLTESEQATLMDSIKDVVRSTYRLKRYGNNNKDEDNSPKTLNDKNNSILQVFLCNINNLHTAVWFQITYNDNNP